MSTPIGPKYVEIFGPLLMALVRIGGSGHKNAVIQDVAFLVPSQFDTVAKSDRINDAHFRSNVYMARVYLSSAGYVNYTRRGIWSITEEGRTHAEMSREEAVELYLSTEPRTHIHST